tara:strand:+ start:983 stop:1507 length:525 start_codon:yes stop_codon:yes gene_type:complete
MAYGKTKKMTAIENRLSRPLEDVLPEMVTKQGLSNTAFELGVSKATLGYWLLKLGITVRRVALNPGDQMEVKRVRGGQAMGMFDTLVLSEPLRCPYCEELTLREFQTQAFDPVGLRSFNVGEGLNLGGGLKINDAKIPCYNSCRCGKFVKATAVVVEAVLEFIEVERVGEVWRE